MDKKAYFKKVIWIIIPLVMGILIGSGLTADKRVFYTIVGAVVFVMLFNLLKGKLNQIKEAEDKKLAAMQQGHETIMDVGERTLQGTTRGARIFDNWYGGYVFFLNLGLFIGTFILLYHGQYLWAFTCFLGMNLHIALNQSLRIMNEIKTGVQDKDKQEGDKN